MRIPKSASTSTKPQQIRAVGYVRVSTEIQVSEGVSLETQRIKIRAHCIAHDIDLIEIISDDGVSAKSLDRPGLTRALWMLDAGKAEAVVVVKLDRLTRSVKDLGVLCENYFGKGNGGRCLR
jgi:site-specific DNA recombinase